MLSFQLIPYSMKLKSFLRQTNRLYRLQGKEELKQTKFNTLLLQFALRHKEIIRFDYEYNDTKVYLHTTLLEMEYEREIGGPHGLAVRENLSERKVVFHIMMSVLHWIEGEVILKKSFSHLNILQKQLSGIVESKKLFWTPSFPNINM